MLAQRKQAVVERLQPQPCIGASEIVLGVPTEIRSFSLLSCIGGVGGVGDVGDVWYCMALTGGDNLLSSFVETVLILTSALGGIGLPIRIFLYVGASRPNAAGANTLVMVVEPVRYDERFK